MTPFFKNLITCKILYYISGGYALMTCNYKDMPGKGDIHFGIVVLWRREEGNGVTVCKVRPQQYLQRFIEEEEKNL